MPRERKSGRQNQLEGDEAHIDADEIRELGPLVVFQLTNVRLLDRYDLRTLPQLGVQLLAADIDGIDAARAAGEEDVAESARRCTNVETDAIARIELEVLERRCQLDAAARHPGMLRLGGERRIGCDLLRWLCDDYGIGCDPSGHDGSLSFCAAVEHAALDQQTVDAHAISHVASTHNSSWPGLSRPSTSWSRHERRGCPAQGRA